MQTFLENVQRWFTITLVFLIPLFFLPTTQEFYTTNKFYLLGFGTITLLVFITLKFLANRKISYTSSPFDKIVLAIFATHLISLLFSSPNKIQALTSLPMGLGVIAVLSIFYFVLTGSDNKEPLPLLKVLAFASSIVGLVFIIFYFGPLQNINLPAHLEFLQTDRFSPVGNLLDTLILLGFFLVYTVIQVVATIKSTSARINVADIMTGLLTLAGIGFAGFALYQGIQSQPLQLPPFDVSWYAAVDTLKSLQTAVVGAGVNNFSSVFTSVKPLAYNQTPYWQLNFSLASSTLLQVWVETGLLGLATRLVLVLFVIRELHGLFEAKNQKAMQFTALAVYLLGLMLLLPVSFISLFLVVIFLIELVQEARKNDKADMQTIDVSAFIPIWGLIAVFLLGVIGTSYYFAGRAYAAEYRFKQAIDAVRTNDGQGVYNRQLEAIRLNPYIERYHVQFSQINLLLANNIAQQEEITDQDRQTVAQLIQQAISEAKRAVQLNPQRASNWNNLAVIYRNIINVAQGADAWTIASYRRAILQDPNNPLLRLNLGGVYYSLQDYDSALRSFEQSVSLKPDWPNAHYNLAWALYQTGDLERAVAAMENVLRLISPDSESYATAQENLEAFRQQLEEVDNQAGQQLNPLNDTNATAAGELNVPVPPAPRLSPQLELPDNAGPEDTIEENTEEETDETSEETEEEAPTPTQGI